MQKRTKTFDDLKWIILFSFFVLFFFTFYYADIITTQNKTIHRIRDISNTVPKDNKENC